MGADGTQATDIAITEPGPTQDGLNAVATPVSGLYVQPGPGRAELRLDVDGPQPQMTASGVFTSGLTQRLHWIAKLRPTSTANRYRGDIWFRDGAASISPHTRVQVTVDPSSSPRRATVVFSGGAPPVTRTYHQRSSGFRRVEFEYDVVQGAPGPTAIDTWAHPNRPTSLPRETLSIETVFQRAGFDVSRSGGDNAIPISQAGADRVWTNAEMHDAMQTYWSRFANSSQWSLWVLFASLHEDGPNLGGIMFDDIGPNHRQGTAIFGDAFIAQPPAGDLAPAAWVDRMRFWTAVHEMGHAFNLAHAWQKTLYSMSWIPMQDEPAGRSFMNYPYRVAGGQTAFFSDFAYQFSDQELLFMRHAPERFVQMGNAAWFDHHGFEQAESSPEPRFKLTLRVNRDQPVFEFLEPCVVELKLTNTGAEPVLVREKTLRNAERMVVIIRKQGQEARQWTPYARYCTHAPKVVLEAGASAYDTVFVGAGRNGWDLSEPGRYMVQVLVRVEGEDVVSNPLYLTVRPPQQAYDEEKLAQDLLTDEVGRVLAFDGSRVLDRANDVLREAIDRFPERAVARHARIALGKALLRPGKVLVAPGAPGTPMRSAADAQAVIDVVGPHVEEAVKELSEALLAKPVEAAQTLSHIDFRDYGEDLAKGLAAEGDAKRAAEVQQALYDALAARKVPDWVLKDVKSLQAELSKGSVAA